jgi:hypothetical protein
LLDAPFDVLIVKIGLVGPAVRRADKKRKRKSFERLFHLPPTRRADFACSITAGFGMMGV